MRWRIDGGGVYTRMIDADRIETGRWRERFFVRNGCVVFTISGSVYVPIEPVPTMRLIGGPKDGQVASTTWETPFIVYFQPVVPLDINGAAIRPVPSSELPGLVDVYRHSTDCGCGLRMRGHFEHEYVWADPRENEAGG